MLLHSEPLINAIDGFIRRRQISRHQAARRREDLTERRRQGRLERRRDGIPE